LRRSGNLLIRSIVMNLSLRGWRTFPFSSISFVLSESALDGFTSEQLWMAEEHLPL
jgi:hypothetical protein